MDKPALLFVHGSWHGPWVWNLVRPLVEAAGHPTAAVALPSVGADPARLGDFRADSGAVAAAAAALPGPVVIVAHSYGGAALSDAVLPPAVRRLVYLAAFMPDSGRSYVSYLPPGPLPPYVGLRGDGTFAVPPGQARPAFYHDLPEPLALWAERLLLPQSQAVLGPEVRRAAWRGVPSTYVLATDDRAVPPDLQRAFAGQADSVVEVPSSHSPMLSMPLRLADLLSEIALA